MVVSFLSFFFFGNQKSGMTVNYEIMEEIFVFQGKVSNSKIECES